MIHHPYRVTLAFLALVLLGPPAVAVVYVDADATGAGDGSSWTDAFTDLHAALAATSSGEIWVAEGTYTPAGPDGSRSATFLLKNGVTLNGGFAGGEISRDERDPATHPTVLSGDLNDDDGPDWTEQQDNSFHVVTAIGANETAVLDGFTITAGRAVAASGTSSSGAGLWIQDASPLIADCRIERNIAVNGGGALVWNGSPDFHRTTFDGNFANYGRGGGVHVTGSGSEIEFADCSFIGNLATSGGNLGYAGAIYADLGTVLRIARGVFVGNSCDFGCCGGSFPAEGGAIVALGDGTLIVDSLFMGNRAHDAGALYLLGDATIVNSVFTGNLAYESLAGGGYGGALVVAFGQVTLAGCTFTGNSGTSDAGGLYVGTNGTTQVRNSIFWDNTGGPDTPTARAQIHGEATIRYSCVQGLLEPIPGEDPPDPGDFPGSIDEDPRFEVVDVSLTPGSPCIDSGEHAGFPAGVAADFAGRGRFHDDPDSPNVGAGTPPVDMGAHEFRSPTGHMDVARLDVQGNTLELTWNDPTCPAAAGFHVVVGGGSLLPSSPTDRYPIDDAACNLPPSPPFVWHGVPDPAADAAGFIWWLIVPDDGLGTEGSWGRNSANMERYGPGPRGESGRCGMVAKDPASVCGP